MFAPQMMMNPMMSMGNPMMMMGMMNPMMMMMMQMMQMMQQMQMMMGQQMGGGCGCGMPGGMPGMPMGDMMGNSMGFPPQFSPQMGFPGYAQPPYGGQAPGWGGGYPYSAPPSYGPQGPWSSAPMAGPGDFQGSGMGNAIARSANNVVSTNWSPGGYCYRGVKRALAPLGVNLQGGSAYMAADQLAQNPRFREIQCSREQLRSLPPGAVVVWNRGNGRPHGHISIALGNGMEASDKRRRQITNYPTSFRVFLPREGGQGGPQHINR